ncbi:MAG: 16S rRNA (cytosine(967)-C(5))-methyltransferase RsmB [Neisseriaceae bacterium]|nr:MAG: 16S rRNA (cytosine(967)-C(5))-methyltransferase RsmB [Neisseriaceae bacterium]
MPYKSGYCSWIGVFLNQNKIQTYAVKILKQVLLERRNLTDVFACVFFENSLKEIPVIKDISYGVLRYYKLLDYWVNCYLKTTLKEIEIYLLLLVALYQLNYTRAAEYAVVNEAVNLAAKKYQGKYKKLVNAVLRNHLRGRPNNLLIPNDNIEALYNLPHWWVNKIINDYPGQSIDIFSAYQTHPPLTLRVNARKIETSDYLNILREESIEAVQWDQFAICLIKPIPVTKIPYFFDGYVSVQDWGAQQAVPLLEVTDDAYVLDACAAPGGKTGHLLEYANCELLALDISLERLKKVEDNLKRLNLSAQLKCADAGKLETWWDGRYFDYILADIPCTASGVVKRNPDIKWLRQLADANNMAKSHEKLIDNLWKCLRSQGKMLIATCSIFREENQDQILKFLSRNPDASLMQQLQILPNKDKDGFYYALVKKD